MCNTGKNSNTSQFFFVLDGKKCDKLSGKHVAFGEVVEGFDIIDEIEKCGTADDEGKPVVKVCIADCGVL